MAPFFAHGLDRRTFIKGLGYTGAGLVFATLGGCETLCRMIRNRPVRRRLRTGSSEVDAAIATYRNAVDLMRALPAGDPRSWSAQADIHGTPAGFNFCHHGTVHFFSWHRAYLLYFEQICRELTGDEKFGLPYWNWNQDLQMHAAFTDPSSALFHPRSNTTLAGFPDPFSDNTLNNIFPDANFFTFGSQIEGTPHNTAHGIIGGDMGGSISARDPIFWMHHCMIDYCWAKWNLELDNDNPSDPTWNDTTWDHFVAGNSDPVSVTAGATPLMPLLSYRYESSAIGSFAAAPEPSASELRAIERRVRKGADVRFEIRKQIRIAERAQLRVARPFSSKLRVAPADLAALIESDAAAERIFVRVDYVSLPASNDFFVRVFLNLPAANAATSTDDPHYAGSFAFFGKQDAHAGHEGSHHQPKTDFLVHATDTLRRLRQSGELRPDAPLSVQLVAVPFAQELELPEAELSLEGVDLIVTPVHIRSR